MLTFKCFIFQMGLLLILCLLLSLMNLTEPEPILINEIMTKVTTASQYLELARNSDDSELDLNGFSVVIAQTSTDRHNKKLQVTLGIDLSGQKLTVGQRFIVIGRHENEAEANDLMPFKPASPNFQLVNRQLTAKNWLDVGPDRYMVVFLVHSAEKRIFEDSSIWPYKTGHSQLKKMSDDLEHYLLSNFVDILFIRGTSVPPVCKDLTRIFVPEFLDDVQSIVTTGPSLDELSISRCGLEFKKAQFHNFKSSAKTPGRPFLFQYILMYVPQFTANVRTS